MFKKVLLHKKAVAFDLDGTIAITRPYWKTAIAVVASRYGIVGIDIEPLLHHEVDTIWGMILQTNTPQPLKTVSELTEETYGYFLELCTKAQLEYLEGFPETMALLKTEKKFKVLLTTNTIKKVADKMLEILDIKFYFNDFVYRDEVSKIKPDPEMYKLAAKKAGVKTSELLVFEDSPIGAEAAVKAGCDVIVIWDGTIPQEYYPNDTKIKAYIGDFADFWVNADVDPQEEIQKRLQESMEIAKEALKAKH